MLSDISHTLSRDDTTLWWPLRASRLWHLWFTRSHDYSTIIWTIYKTPFTKCSLNFVQNQPTISPMKLKIWQGFRAILTSEVTAGNVRHAWWQQPSRVHYLPQIDHGASPLCEEKQNKTEHNWTNPTINTEPAWWWLNVLFGGSALPPDVVLVGCVSF